MKGSLWELPGAIDRLRVLWSDGHSASRISVLLLNEFGVRVSRNAVIAKVHRLKLPARRTRHANRPLVRAPRIARRQPPKTEAKATPRPARKTKRDVEQVEAPPQAVRRAILTAADTYCRWPINGDDEPFQMCGAAVAKGCGPYCTYHSRRAWQPGTSLNGRKKPKGGGFTPFYGNASLNFTTGASS